MTDTSPPADPPAQTAGKPPRFNHLGLSLAADALDERGRSEILDFYGTVFGWQELPTMTIDRQRLVMMAHRYDQFVFLIADDQPMRSARLDHFGQSAATLGELHDLYARAEQYAAHDDRVDLIAPTVEEHPGLRLHSWYVGFLLPLMIETQHWEWT